MNYKNQDEALKQIHFEVKKKPFPSDWMLMWGFFERKKFFSYGNEISVSST